MGTSGSCALVILIYGKRKSELVLSEYVVVPKVKDGQAGGRAGTFFLPWLAKKRNGTTEI